MLNFDFCTYCVEFQFWSNADFWETSVLRENDNALFQKSFYLSKSGNAVFRKIILLPTTAMLFLRSSPSCQHQQCLFPEVCSSANVWTMLFSESSPSCQHQQCLFPETHSPANINNVFSRKLTPLPTYGQCYFPVGISRHFQVFDTALIPAPLISGRHQMYLGVFGRRFFHLYLDVDFSILQSFFHRAMLYPTIKYKSSGQGVIPYRWYSPRAARHDSVKLRSRQYSLDERRYECRADALCL